ncbi:acyl-CoA dehydrogenase [Azospirillum sp. RWY-5-1]|uniref:Acyl-CoA dehydrogenase n=1 Tax=Azospirillum oleiclasticum TaxID=2735135 RepID=A0ABX2TFY5_9PROT|nr:acyl-CoA dehydrogenase family protein [Azospirillum oleiclasticum]NYZ14398.1 acyl-CoA dehydrogenase [Azospirillum oleiclasticum]NYZ23250.1 acyl-CoA dehydrogenase [Azospirillum oleiclasticum]
MDFSIPDDLQALKGRVGAFIRDEIIPCENDPRQSPHGPSDAFRRELNARARAAGLLAPHMPAGLGGLGLDHRGKAVVFEAAGYSLLGPLALNIAAPDEGNMHLLEQVADERQKRRWLAPLAMAETRSCFAMTEPSPGAGADPSALLTRYRKVAGGYVVSGTKWLISGATGAAFCIIMARDEASPEGEPKATMFLADMDRPGIVIERTLDTIDQSFPGGHCVVSFHDLFVPEEDVLGREGEGFRYAQVRLAPARLTHCMRWLGAAQRAHDVATAYARQRRAFGRALIDHEGVGFQLADNELDLHTCRLVVAHTAWVLDRGGKGRHESSMAKVICSEAIWRIVDRSLQVLGGLGTTGDTVVERIFREVRPFRIYDGPSEVHRWSIARKLAREAVQ